jgi:hypothetical protein
MDSRNQESLGHVIPYEVWLIIKEDMFGMICRRKFNDVIVELMDLRFKKSKYDKRKRGWRYEVRDKYFGLNFEIKSHFCGKCGNIMFDFGSCRVYDKYCCC